MTASVESAPGWAKGETEQTTPKSTLPESEKVPLESLSELTGFPVDFIKSELLLKDDELSMGELRQSMVNYIESTSKVLTDN